MGELAQARGDSSMALRLWAEQRQRYPLEPAAYRLSGKHLREQRQWDDADSILKDGIARFADETSLAVEYALVAQDRSDWPEALRRWDSVLAKFPLHVPANGGAVKALMALHAYVEADTRLAVMKKFFPDDYYFSVLSAVVATERHEWSSAIDRWNEVKQIKPDCQLAASHLATIGSIIANRELETVVPDLGLRLRPTS